MYPRVFMTLRVPQFSLKMAHLSFSMGPRGPRAYSLRPRLWLLKLVIRVDTEPMKKLSKIQRSQRTGPPC